MATDDANTDKRNVHYEGGIPILDVHRIEAIELRQAESEERDKKNKQKQQVDRVMMYSTIVLALCAVLGGLYQAYVARLSADAAIANAQAAKAQVGELRQSGTDTHDLAKAAQNQATNTEKLANAAINQVGELEASVKEAHALAKASQDALSVTRDNFVKDQQPYIWVTPQAPKLEEGRPVRWDIRYSNYGRSPAYHVQLCTSMTLGINAVSNLLPLSMTQCGEAAKAQGEVVTDSVFPPGYQQYTTVASHVAVDQSAIDVLKSHDGAVVVRGIFVYQDAFGHSYESTFCRFVFATAAVASCPKYNYIRQLE